MVAKLWPHQVEAIDFVADKPAAMLAMAMGTGKSRVAIDLLKSRAARKILILCPSSVVDVWPHQFNIHAPGEFQVLALRTGPVRQRQTEAARFFARLSRNQVLVINYEACYRETMDTWLLKQEWDAIICDESHRIKAPGGVQSRFVAKLAKDIPFRLALTGTPMPHSPLDVYGQYRYLDPTIFGTSIQRMRNEYAVTKFLPGIYAPVVVGYKNMEDLNKKFYTIAYKVDVNVLELPDPLHEVRMCVLSNKAQKIYDDLSEEFYAEVDDGVVTAANALVRALRLQQLTGGYLRVSGKDSDTNVDTAKMGLLSDLLADLDEPVVVFCRFRRDLDTVHDVATKLKIPSCELSGRVNQLAEWQGAPTAKILAVQTQAGGVGIDLTKARVAIYYSLGLSLGDHLQSQARLHRPGQKGIVVYYYLLADRTIDEKVHKALLARKEVIEEILKR